MMKVKRLYEYSKLPTKAHAGDLGYDLYAAEYTTIYAGETVLIPTGIAIEFPEGYGGLIRDRSSVAIKRKLFNVAGVIDNGYTGEIKIALYNSTDEVQVVYSGDKIAQLILLPVINYRIREVDEIESSDGRGSDGFGSTGT